LDDFSFEEAHTKIQSQYEFKMDYDFVWQHQNYFHPIITRSTRDINGKYAPVELESIYNRYNDGEITEVEMLTGHNSIWTSIQNNGQPLQEISKDDDFFVENAFLLLPNVKFPNYYLCNNTIAYQSPSINDPDYTVLHSTIKVNSSMIMPEGDPLSYWHNNQDDWEITNILYCSPFDDSVLPIYYDLDEYTATFSFHEPDLNIPSDLAYMDVTITAKLGITFVNGYSYWLTFSNGEQIFNVGY
jgi:hypothetical protein